MKLKQKINNDGGFVLGVVYMMFLIMMLSLTALSMNVHNNSKYTDMTVSDDVSYYFADYGIQKVQDTIAEHIKTLEKTPAGKVKLQEYIHGKTEAGTKIPGMKILQRDINEIILKPTYFGEDIWVEGSNNAIRLSVNLKSLDAKVDIEKPDPVTGKFPANPYVIIVTATVRDKSRGQGAVNVTKLGTRITSSEKSKDHTTPAEEVGRLYEVLYSSIVEVGKVNNYETTP